MAKRRSGKQGSDELSSVQVQVAVLPDHRWTRRNVKAFFVVVVLLPDFVIVGLPYSFDTSSDTCLVNGSSRQLFLVRILGL